MSLSTASNKSACITFALLALTTSSAFASESASSLVQECNDCSSSSSSSSSSSAIFESSSIIHKRPIPIHLPSLSTIIDNGESVVDGTDNASQRNASVYFDDSNDDDEGESDHMEYDYAFEEQPVEFQLPAELASLIATAKYTSSPSIEESSSSSSPAAAPSLGQVRVRYYATHSGNTDTELCSSKSASKFELWEESYESLKECCEVNFGWEFDSCVGIL